ncbi:MAG: hypothetical protein ACKO3K_02070 [Cuspidothrix sp.]
MEAIFESWSFQTCDQAISSLRLALNDPIFALNSLLKLDAKVDPRFCENPGTAK